MTKVMTVPMVLAPIIMRYAATTTMTYMPSAMARPMM